ncbi:MAG: PD-(D/E)XK nuclease family protein [Anaerolineae bacterium]|nr:PD-(D/E)XK nuclease family protein [Anaerolineae bacterium]
MFADNLVVLDRMTLEAVEAELNRHTTEQILPDDYTRFTWSHSRHQVFSRCRRQYYLNYYASRRVRQSKRPVVSAAWWLKQLTSLNAWIGTVVHRAAQHVIANHIKGRLAEPEAVVVATALLDYQGGLATSRRCTRHDGDWVLLMEHHYPDIQPPDEDSGMVRVEELVHALLESETLRWVLSLPPEAIREADDGFRYFMLEEAGGFEQVKCFAVTDVLTIADGQATIIDWKTGGAEKESSRLQTGVYRLYAHRVYGLPEANIGTRIVDVNSGQAVAGPEIGVAEAEQYVRSSIAEMVGLMEDTRYNTAAIADYPMTDDLNTCQGCGFRRICWRHTA